MGNAAVQLDFDLDAAASVTGPSPHCERQASGGSRAGCAHTGTFNGPVTAAAAQRHSRMREALDHAGEHWKTEAYTFLCTFARTNHTFTGEQVSDAHIAGGHPQPPDLRAWGALYRRAMGEGVISFLDNDGWSRRRASPCTRYVSMVIGGSRHA